MAAKKAKKANKQNKQNKHTYKLRTLTKIKCIKNKPNQPTLQEEVSKNKDVDVMLKKKFFCRFCPSRDDELFNSMELLHQHEMVVHELGKTCKKGKQGKAYKPMSDISFWCRFCETHLCDQDGLQAHELKVHKIDTNSLSHFVAHGNKNCAAATIVLDDKAEPPAETSQLSEGLQESGKKQVTSTEYQEEKKLETDQDAGKDDGLASDKDMIIEAESMSTSNVTKMEKIEGDCQVLQEKSELKEQEIVSASQVNQDEESMDIQVLGVKKGDDQGILEKIDPPLKNTTDKDHKDHADEENVKEEEGANTQEVKGENIDKSSEVLDELISSTTKNESAEEGPEISVKDNETNDPDGIQLKAEYMSGQEQSKIKEETEASDETAKVTEISDEKTLIDNKECAEGKMPGSNKCGGLTSDSSSTTENIDGMCAKEQQSDEKMIDDDDVVIIDVKKDSDSHEAAEVIIIDEDLSNKEEENDPTLSNKNEISVTVDSNEAGFNSFSESAENTFKCSVCSYLASDRKDMIFHFAETHNASLPCRFCDDPSAVFQYITTLKFHEMSMHKVTDQALHEFLWKLKPKSQLTVTGDGEEAIYRCSFCEAIDSVFPDFEQLQEHELMVHGLTVEKMNAIIEGKVIKLEDDDDDDVEFQIENEQENDDKFENTFEKIPSCPTHPELIFLTMKEYRKHQKDFHGYSHKCLYCDAEFFKLGQLAYHELCFHDISRSHSTWLPINEKSCKHFENDSSCYSDSELSDESLLGKDEEDSEFIVLDDVDGEMEEEMGPPVCPLCTKKTEFTTREDLREHWRKCHYKTFNPCPVCPFVFKKWEELRNHEIKTHKRTKADILRCIPTTYRNLKIMQICIHKIKEEQGPNKFLYHCPSCLLQYDKFSRVRNCTLSHKSVFFCRFCHTESFREAIWREAHEDQSHNMKKEDALRYVSLVNRFEFDEQTSEENKDEITEGEKMETCALEETGSKKTSAEEVDAPKHSKKEKLKDCPKRNHIIARVCYYCQKKEKSYQKLAQHMLFMHDDVSEYLDSKDTPEQENDSDSLSDTISDSSLDSSDSEEERQKCPFCSKSYSSTQYLREHCSEAHRSRFFPCPLCLYISGSWQEMLKHEKEVHKRRERDILRCIPATYKGLSELWTFIDMQSDDVKSGKQKRYECPLCNMASRSKEKVTTHSEKHCVGEYHCRICFDCSYSRARLRLEHELEYHNMSGGDMVRYVDNVEANLLEKYLSKSSKRERQRSPSEESSGKRRRSSKSISRRSRDRDSRAKDSDEDARKRSDEKPRSDGKVDMFVNEDEESTDIDEMEKPKLLPNHYSSLLIGAFDCMYCTDVAFQTRGYLKDHFKKDHNITEVYVCHFCNSTVFPTEEFLEIHELVEHQMTKEDTEYSLQYAAKLERAKNRKRKSLESSDHSSSSRKMKTDGRKRLRTTSASLLYLPGELEEEKTRHSRKDYKRKEERNKNDEDEEEWNVVDAVGEENENSADPKEVEVKDPEDAASSQVETKVSTPKRNDIEISTVASSQDETEVLTSKKTEIEVSTSEKTKTDELASQKLNTDVSSSGQAELGDLKSDKNNPEVSTSGQITIKESTSEKPDIEVSSSGQIKTVEQTSDEIKMDVSTSEQLEAEGSPSGKIEMEASVSAQNRTDDSTSEKIETQKDDNSSQTETEVSTSGHMEHCDNKSREADICSEHSKENEPDEHSQETQASSSVEVVDLVKKDVEETVCGFSESKDGNQKCESTVDVQSSEKTNLIDVIDIDSQDSVEVISSSNISSKDKNEPCVEKEKVGKANESGVSSSVADTFAQSRHSKENAPVVIDDKGDTGENSRTPSVELIESTEQDIVECDIDNSINKNESNQEDKQEASHEPMEVDQSDKPSSSDIVEKTQVSSQENKPETTVDKMDMDNVVVLDSDEEKNQGEDQDFEWSVVDSV